MTEEATPKLVPVSVRVVGNDSLWRAGKQWAAGKFHDAEVTPEQRAALDADPRLEVRYPGKKGAEPSPHAPAPKDQSERIAALEQKLRDAEGRHVQELQAATRDASQAVSRLRGEYEDKVRALESDVATLTRSLSGAAFPPDLISKPQKSKG